MSSSLALDVVEGRFSLGKDRFEMLAIVTPLALIGIARMTHMLARRVGGAALQPL
jgi:hypothetical protein